MIINFQGKKYNFKIVSENGKKEILFYIRAICKSTRRTSCINNLNAIMARLLEEKDEYLNDMRYVDSSWVVLKNEAKKFTKIALKYLSNHSYIDYLERKLDEDRACGEWENIITENGEIKEYEEKE